MSAQIQSTVSPIDHSVVVERTLPTQAELDQFLDTAVAAQQQWKKTPLSERIDIARRFVEEFAKLGREISSALTVQMGRPTSQGMVEVDGTIVRAHRMLDLAPESLADVSNPDTDLTHHKRYVKKVPVGVVFCISPWNWPLFCQVNVVLPAIVAGNAVVLKPSPQTPLSGEQFLTAFETAGLPNGVLQVVHLTSDQVAGVVGDRRTHFVNFTGSVANGHAMVKAAAGTFKGLALELGGKDPAYVRADVDVDSAARNLAVGATFNAGQSCCSVERIYVHEAVYDKFVEKASQPIATSVSVANATQLARHVGELVLGDPRDEKTTLGPVVSLRSANFIKKQVAEAVAAGARALVLSDKYAIQADGNNYVQPQVMVNVDHSMSIMTEETFGPVVGVMKVKSDEEAIDLMNDSPFGLTASIWTDATKSLAAFEQLSEQVETGTVFLNGADFVDANLAWAGVKDSGRGRALSKLGYDCFINTKSMNVKLTQDQGG
ncbi:hypothetical protein Q5752_005296 [Cryptotrichosporon argae]